MKHYLKRSPIVLIAALISLLLLISCDVEDNKTLNEEKANTKDAQVTKNTSNLNLHVSSPEWQDQIIYFLMIDRFNDGNNSNNNQGAGEYNPNNNAYFSGGDLKGITQQLDYIKNLGVTSVWITPPVVNQWWSTRKQSAGYHGYWAKDFKNVDIHFGTLEEYKKLSSELHNRGMYLIQDIVTNHTGNYFEYDGNYDVNNLKHNYRLSESENSQGFAPSQKPFNNIDLNNPNHEKADIYHWTPEINNYNDPYQEKNYQLSGLADLNTSNPIVIKALQESYSYWIQEVGVDGFRIDTVKFVEHKFWNKFLHGKGGIVDAAKLTGRDNFLNFGEVFEISPEFSDSGERKAASYLGSKVSPELNSVLGFPLFAELGRVFAQGRPTANLAYRLKKQMEIYPNPYVIPNFVDNHDSQRFLADGNLDALKQALFTIFTIPGIPVIYQGTEQAFTETREAMFKGGFHSDKNHFDNHSEMYLFIKELAEIRRSHKALSRGNLEIIAEDKSNSGVIAFKREYKDQKLLIIINSADREKLLSNLNIAVKPNQVFKILYKKNINEANKSLQRYLKNARSGLLTLELPPRSLMIFSIEDSIQSDKPKFSDKISITQDYSNQTLTQDSLISGHVNWKNSKLKLVINSDLAFAKDIGVDVLGNWTAVLPVSKLGINENRFVIYSANKNIATIEQTYFTQRNNPQHLFVVKDSIGDDKGPSGNYQSPQHEASEEQMDIEKVTVKTAGDILDLEIKVKQISTVWNPANGFDNVSFSLFFSLPNAAGLKQLPGLNTNMPQDLEWSFAHVFYGWGNSVYSHKNSTDKVPGEKIAASPQIIVDKAKRVIRVIYNGQAFALEDWSGVKIYISTWDKTGEGEYRPASTESGKWNFTTDSKNSPKIMDDIFVAIPENKSVKI